MCVRAANVFFPIYMAKRLEPVDELTTPPASSSAAAAAPALPTYAPAIGAVAGAVGTFSVWWALAARPELAGGLAERVQYTQTLLATRCEQRHSASGARRCMHKPCRRAARRSLPI